MKEDTRSRYTGIVLIAIALSLAIAYFLWNLIDTAEITGGDAETAVLSLTQLILSAGILSGLYLEKRRLLFVSFLLSFVFVGCSYVGEDADVLFPLAGLLERLSWPEVTGAILYAVIDCVWALSALAFALLISLQKLSKALRFYFILFLVLGGLTIFNGLFFGIAAVQTSHNPLGVIGCGADGFLLLSYAFVLKVLFDPSQKEPLLP